MKFHRSDNFELYIYFLFIANNFIGVFLFKNIYNNYIDD